MKQKTQILYIGSHTEILEVMVRLLNKSDTQDGYGAPDFVEAFRCGCLHALDIVLIGSGLSDEEEEDIVTILNEQNPDTVFVQHMGGGSGILISEIETALHLKKKNRVAAFLS